MITIAHLMDDFGMGGVTQALTLFEQPLIKRQARSKVVPVRPDTRLAPRLDADLIVDHATLSWARLPFLISLRARNPQARIVHIEHSYTRAFEDNHVRAKTRFRTLLRIAARFYDETVCVSDAQRDWLLTEVGLACDSLRVIYPWTDRTQLFALPAANPCPDRPVRLLAYGRYAAMKNFAELISAMRFIDPSQAQLTLFGDGPERTLLEALAADLPHVHVNGPCPDPKEYLAHCDAVVIPSRYEAFGLVATEARMAARAVLVADIDGLPEQAAEGGLVAPLSNACDIAKVIVWSTRADLKSLGMAARRGVKSQHSAILHRWSQLFAEVEAGGSHRKAAERSASLEEIVA